MAMQRSVRIPRRIIHVNLFNEEKSQISRAVKKAYSKPQLIVYGDLREITRGGNTSGAVDHNNAPGNPNHVKTH